MSVFEWGSGGSTAFFARRVRRVVSVEHDAAWHERVVVAVREKGFKNTSLNLVEPEEATAGSNGYTSTDARYEGYTFESYVRSVDSYPDFSFDLIVVDGRSRPECIHHTLSKIKPGGFLLLDNSERDAYEAGWRIIPHWQSMRFHGPGPYNEDPWETRIWQKPQM